ncbi:MAG: amidohydrolase family protein [Xanthobacteraceae bacterium]
MITDVHCHFVPDEFLRFAQNRAEYAVRRKRAEGEEIDFDIRGVHFELNKTFFDLRRQLGRMDELGIERTILSLATPFIDYHLDAALGVEAARIFNDALAREIGAERRRFGAWAFLPMQDPDAAAAELRRCVREHSFVGGHVASNVRGVYLHADAFQPIFEAATDLDVPLFVHPADPAGKDRTREYELTVVAGYLFDNTINILKMICSGFLDRWPRLKLVCAHTGAFSLVLRARMQREVDTNRALSGTLRQPVGEYLRRLYFDTICFEPDILRYAASVVPVEHLVMGSDAPFPLGEPDPLNFVKRSLPAEAAAAILSTNFEKLLGT